jgi:hypothetical protein
MDCAYGMRAIAHAGPRVIGLDGVVAQQQNYRKSGFELAYANVRYGATVAAPDAPQAGVIALAEVPLAAVEAASHLIPNRRPTLTPPMALEVMGIAEEISSTH